MALTFLGATAFTQKFPPRYSYGTNGLDTVTYTYWGAVDGLTNFLASPLTYGNMFLTSISVDDNRQYPTVTLEYIGIRGGTGAYGQKGLPRWTFGGFDLDTVSVDYWGPASRQAAFVAGQQTGGPSTVDGNMFLTSVSSDGDLVFPTTTLTYSGFRGGRLPPDQHSTGLTVQQASTTAEVEILGNQAIVRVDVLYLGPTATVTSYSRTPSNAGSGSAAAPANVTIVATSVSSSGFLVGNLDAASYFKQVVVTTSQSDEIVPGRVYRTRTTNTRLLFPIPRILGELG